jgi:uncharacterized protein YkwD
MGRHRRATPTTTAEHTRRRGAHRRRGGVPVRSGLLGASAAMAVGAVAVASGLIPGTGGDYTVGEAQDSGTRVRVDAGAELATQGSTAPPTTSPPRSSTPSADRAEPDGKPSDSATPSRTARERSTPSQTTRPSRSPSSPESGDSSSPGGGHSGTPGTSPEPTGTPGGDGQSAAEARVLALVNAERAAAGCRPLTAEPALARLAGAHSADMAERGYFSHTTPDGKSPWDRAEEAGVDGMGGENIAMGQQDAEAVMSAWMNSEGHRANILNCDFRTLGVGAHFASGGPWWTQNFGY